MLRRFLCVTALAAIVLASPDASTQPPTASSGGADQRSPELEAAIRAVVRNSTFKDATIGIAILDVDSGRYLAAHNEHTLLNPASNAKLFTAFAALEALGPDHRYETTLSGAPKGRDAIGGPLVLRGHGDPSLSTADLWEMVQELRAYGIRKIDGDIMVNQTFFDDQTTPPAFEQQPNEWSYFRAPVSAVALNENCVTMTVRPSGASGGSASVNFDPPGFVDVIGNITTGDEGSADNVTLALAGSDKRMSAKVGGSIAVDSRLVRYTKRAEDPQLLAGYALKALLEKADIKLSGDVKEFDAHALKAGSKVLAKHQSAPLSQLLYAVGKRSDNFYAEMIFKTLGGEAKGRPASSANGADVVTQWVGRVGAGDNGVSFTNGSGLFAADKVTPASVVLLLRAAWRDPTIQPEYLAQLAIGGVDGTLHKRFRQEKTRKMVRAKTGTLDEVIALSGYVLSPSPSKGPIAFSILFNKVGGKADGARAAADKLVEMIARSMH